VPVAVVTDQVLASTWAKCRSPRVKVRSSGSRRRVPMTRWQMAFILGIPGKVVMIRSPSAPEHLPEYSSEQRIAIMDQEPQRGEAVT